MQIKTVAAGKIGAAVFAFVTLGGQTLDLERFLPNLAAT